MGLALEEIYGQGYTSLLNDYLRDELDMEHTGVSNGGADFEGNWEWDADDAYIAVGAVVSDIGDMLRYASVQLGDDPVTALCHQSIKEVNASDEWNRLSGICVDEVGMSWIIDKEHGFVWHNGGTGVHSSYLGFCPEENTAVVVLSNLSQNVDIPATALGHKRLLELSMDE